MIITQARSGVDNASLQEIIDAHSGSVGQALFNGAQQYESPDWLSRMCAELLPFRRFAHVLDPQGASGRLVRQIDGDRLVVDIDNRFHKQRRIDQEYNVTRAIGACLRFDALLEDLWPDQKFECIVANPPFGLKWEKEDSTAWTWGFIERRLAEDGCGFFIANAKTIEELGIHQHKSAYLYQTMEAGNVWEGVGITLGIVHFHATDLPRTVVRYDWGERTPCSQDAAMFILPQLDPIFRRASMYRPYAHHAKDTLIEAAKIMAEEHENKARWNISLGKDGLLQTYLSTYNRVKFTKDDVAKLAFLNGCHPLTLTTEKESRATLARFLEAGVYTIEPAAKKAIEDALAEARQRGSPVRAPTDFELVAYADEQERLTAKASFGGGPEIVTPYEIHTGMGAIIKQTRTDRESAIALTPGKAYDIKTGTYKFSQRFVTKKLHTSEEGECSIVDHECELSGMDRFIEIRDDRGSLHRFMDRPEKDHDWQHPEKILWDLFEKPAVRTIAEVEAAAYARNLDTLRINEALGGFSYYAGQLDYYARMGIKNYGLIAADVGTGKTCGALSLIAMKSPRRALIVAPQGTMRSSEEEDDREYHASQWVSEIQRFAPGEPIFQLFSREDWQRILNANAGVLPPGIYITYPQAYWQNQSLEFLPATWEDEAEQKFCKRIGIPFDKENIKGFSDQIGHEVNGIRCIYAPSLATEIAQRHGEWDMVIVDEAHLMTNLSANVTQNLIRMQPTYRYLMTATPIPNIVSNLFSLLGWLCVPDWYMGDKRNVAWPYAVDEIGRFRTTFMAQVRDLTAEQKAKNEGKKNARCISSSPIISSPARLLKLLRPTMAYISLEDCNPKIVPYEVIDVRVPMGAEQQKLYAWWLDRRHMAGEYSNPLTIAAVQSSRLRGVCAAPASLDYTRGMCGSNFNPKQVTILQLIRDCFNRGEQVVVVSARVGQSSALWHRLSDAGISTARIDSTVPAAEHTKEANRFKSGRARVMLMGIKCAQGHSFEMCPNLIVGSLEWTYGTFHQTKGRVRRLNSAKPIKIWCVLHKNSIEELLFDRVAVKRDAATLCLHGERVPVDFHQADASEILVEHIVNYNAEDGAVMSELACESQWPELRKQLVLANKTQ